MSNLIVFENVSLDGYFCDAHGDMSFAHRHDHDPEWSEFVSSNASGGGMLLFGRITYEMMASFWPTAQAAAAMPVVAERMNHLPKVVFSRTLRNTSWENTRLVESDPVREVRRLKQESGLNLALMGSGSLLAPLAQAGLVDEFQLVVNPIALGSGRSLFEALEAPLALALKSTRRFRNGNVLLCYTP